MHADIETVHGKTKTKVERYGWEVQDEPGKMEYISKHLLRVDERYQRNAAQSRILVLARNWSWFACGALQVARRTEGGTTVYYVVDGGHRHGAAMRRADIEKLPCLVFESTGVPDEARAFLTSNTNRRAMYSVEKFKALREVGDKNALLVDELLQQSGRTPSSASGATTVGCLSALLRAAKENRAALQSVWPVLAEACHGRSIIDKVVQGLVYIEARMPDGESLRDARWRKRVVSIGGDELVSAAVRAASFYARGGGRVYAKGMLNSINKGLRQKIIIPGLADE
jgi:hypothetical protein